MKNRRKIRSKDLPKTECTGEKDRDKKRQRILRLDNERNRGEVDPLLREFVEEVTPWVKSSMSMMVQVGNFLWQFLHRHKRLAGPHQTLLVNVSPFRLALVSNTTIVGFSYRCRRIFVDCDAKKSSYGPRSVNDELGNLLPRHAHFILDLLAKVQHPICFPFNRGKGMLRQPQYPRKMTEQTEMEQIQDMIWEGALKPFSATHPYWDLLFQVESHLRLLICNWWCGSVQSLAQMGSYGYQLLHQLSESVSERWPMPRFLQDKEIPSILAGIVYVNGDDETQYLLGIDMHGNIIDKNLSDVPI